MRGACSTVYAIALVCGVGCGSSRPQVRIEDPGDGEDHVNAVAAPPDAEPMASAQRPAIELTQLIPDSTERGRWPLGMATHPVLEPHFDVGEALAAPGVGWLELCGRGIQRRHLSGNQDPVEYLRAWCSALSHDAPDAIARLASLRSTVVRGIRAALWLDIANILADNGDARAATKLIDRNHLEHEVELLDIVAATYVEVGKRDDATELGQLATEADHSGVTDCDRLARQIVIADRVKQEQLLADLRRSRFVPCAPIEHELRCWLYASTLPAQCEEYFADRKLDAHYGDVLWAFQQWPESNTGTWFLWWRIGVSASRAIGIAGAEDLALTALDASLRASGCDTQHLIEVRKVLDTLRKEPARDPHLDARIDVMTVKLVHLTELTTELCKRELAAPR